MKKVILVLGSLIMVSCVSVAKDNEERQPAQVTTNFGKTSSGWQTLSAKKADKTLSCSSNTGTDGDLGIEVPVRITTTKQKWVSPGDSMNGQTYDNVSVEVLGSTGRFRDVTDESPFTKYPIVVSKGRASTISFTIPKVNYKLVNVDLSSKFKRNGDTDTIYISADTYGSGVGLAICELK